MKTDVQRIYKLHIEMLGLQEKLELINLVIKDAVSSLLTKKEVPHDVMEFAGAVKSSVVKEDAQEYVNKLRSEWDSRD